MAWLVRVLDMTSVKRTGIALVRGFRYGMECALRGVAVEAAIPTRAIDKLSAAHSIIVVQAHESSSTKLVRRLIPGYTFHLTRQQGITPSTSAQRFCI